MDYKHCQSCGMPLKKDPKGGGTNADGSKSNKYCSFCYAGGRFTQPDITAEEMQQFVIGKLQQMGFPRFAGQLFTRKIPNLERWKSANA
jgi:hypothetical protein